LDFIPLFNKFQSCESFKYLYSVIDYSDTPDWGVMESYLSNHIYGNVCKALHK
jgi:hypothetical protein